MDQVTTDVGRFIDLNGGYVHGIEVLSKKSGISIRTLERYLSCEVMPQRQALKRLYFALTDSKDEQELQKCLPAIIFSRVFGRKVQEQGRVLVSSLDLNKEFLHNSIFRSLYIKSIFGPFYREEAEFRFGEESKNVINMMLQRELLDVDSESRLISGKKRLVLNGQAIQIMAIELWQNNFYPSKEEVVGENSFSYNFMGLNLDGYNEVLKLEKRFQDDTDKIRKNPAYRGSIKAWSLSAVDTMTSDKLYPRDWEDLGK